MQEMAKVMWHHDGVKVVSGWCERGATAMMAASIGTEIVPLVEFQC